MLTEAGPYSVIDLDSCRDPETGHIEAWAMKIVELLDSYTEVSPSGRGLHVWVRGKVPGDRRCRGKLDRRAPQACPAGGLLVAGRSWDVRRRRGDHHEGAG